MLKQLVSTRWVLGGAVGAVCLTALASVAQAQSGPFVYVPNVTVSIIDTSTATVAGSTSATGINPIGIAVRGDGSLVYVTNDISNTVPVIDTATNTVSATIATGALPQFVALDPTGSRA